MSMESDEVAANALVDFGSKTASETPIAVTLQKCCTPKAQQVSVLVIRVNRIHLYFV